MARTRHRMDTSLEELFTAHMRIGPDDIPSRHLGAVTFDDKRWGVILSDLDSSYVDAQLSLGVLGVRDIEQLIPPRVDTLVR
jgi:hypothetical protein